MPALVAAVAVLVGSVSAWADWSTPATVAVVPPDHFVTGLQVASGPAGDLLAWSTGAEATNQSWAGYGAVAAPGGSFGSAQRLPGVGSWATPTVVDLGGGRVAQLLLSSDGRTPDSVVVGRTDGTFGRPMRVPSEGTCPSTCEQARLAGDANGDLLVTWADLAGGSTRTVWASLRLAGGVFSAPQRIAGHIGWGSSVVTGAVGGTGVAVVVFDNARGRLFARVRRGRGAWGPAAPIARTMPRYGQALNDVTAFVSSQGEAVIAWYYARGGGAGLYGAGDVNAAVLPIGSRRFRPTQLLHRDSMPLDYAASAMSLAPAIAATPGEAPVVAFIARGSDPSGLSTVIMVAYPPASGNANTRWRYDPPVQLSSTSAAVFELRAAAGPAGQILAWTQSPYWGAQTSVIMASTTPLGDPTGRFQAPEQVSPTGENAGEPAVTFNTASHWPQNDVAPWIVTWLSSAANPATGATGGVGVQVSAPLCPVPAGATPAAADPACAGAG